MTRPADALPPGFVARDDGVAIRPKLFWPLFAWFGVALCLFIAIVMPIDTAQRAADGKKGIEMGGVIGFAVAFGLLAVGTALLSSRYASAARPGWSTPPACASSAGVGPS